MMRDKQTISRIIIAAVIMIILPVTSYALDIALDSHTYYDLHEDEQGAVAKDIGSLYEYLSLSVTGGDLAFVFSGWGRTETLDEKIGFESDENESGDFSAAYIEYSKDYANFKVRFGRQTVLGHGSYESLDGISLTTDLPYKFSISGYAGIPEELEERSSEDDFLSGGRLSLAFDGFLEIGAGYLEKKDFDVTTRREVSTDLWIMPFSKLELYGEAVKNKLTDENAYSAAEAVFTITDTITLTGNYENVDYKHYYSDSEVAIFNKINSDDELTSTGGSLDFSITDNLSIKIDGKDYKYKVAKNDGGTAFGGSVKLTTDSTESAIFYHNTDCDDVARGGYDEYRAYFMLTPEDGLTASLDAVYDSFDKKTNNTDSSLSVTASAGYIFDEDLRVSVDMNYKEDPEYDESYGLFARVEYSFGTSIEISSAVEEKPVPEEEKEDEKEEEAAPSPPKEEIKEEEKSPAPEPTVDEKEAPAVFPLKAPGEAPAPVKEKELRPYDVIETGE